MPVREKSLDAGDTLSTSFYTPTKKELPRNASHSADSIFRNATKMSTTKIQPGSLGVQIKDVVKREWDLSRASELCIERRFNLEARQH